MAMIIEKSEAGFILQLKTFANKIATYQATLGLTNGEIAAVKVDAAALDYVATHQEAVRTFAQNYTTYKNLLRRGDGAILGSLPQMPAFAPPPPMPTAPNAEGRFRDLVQRIGRHANYTRAVGEDLGIEAAATATFSAMMEAAKPTFYIEFSSGGYPNLRWTKGKFDGVEIWKDAGSGYSKLDRDMRPDFIDKSALPAAGTAAVWKYKMIYLKNDEVVGSWSDEASVTVHSEV